MTIKQENKKMMIVISRELYAELEKIAKDNTRSVSRQALHYIRKGIEEDKSVK